MRILVTGGGGFLGTYIVKLLLKEGHKVYSFSRNHYPHLDKLGCKTIQGDLRNFDQVRSAVEGFHAVFHVASKVAMWGKWEDFYKINVVGTKNVIKACQVHGVRKLIYTSTPSVVFNKDSIENGDESLPYTTENLSLYAKSKAMAEKEVLQNNNKEGLLTVALRPHLVYGPGDQNLLPSVIDKAKKNKLKIVGDGNNVVDVLYVENAALAHILAFKKLEESSSVSGQCYFLGQEKPVKLWDFINTLLTKSNIDPLKKKVSSKLTYSIGFLIECFLKLTGKNVDKPLMTRFVSLQLSKSHYYNHQKSLDELGNYHIISTEEGLDRYLNGETQSR